jgi:hypothetical protein
MKFILLTYKEATSISQGASKNFKKKTFIHESCQKVKVCFFRQESGKNID